MKIYFSIGIVLVLVAGVANSAQPITAETAWTEVYPVSTRAPHLVVSNIWGSVRIRTGKTGEISMSVSEVRTAADEKYFQMSLEQIKLDIEADSNGVSIKVGGSEERWKGVDRCIDCRVDYQFDVLVPPDATVDVGTVMDGLIDIVGVAGVVRASNVNGPVSIAGIRDCEEVSNVNGHVSIGFSRAPVLDCSIRTVNGDITLDVPASTSLDVVMDLFNGHIESEFPVGPLDVPATIEHVTEGGHNRYRIRQRRGIRIGAGGPTYAIASMNGDVLIQKK